MTDIVGIGACVMDTLIKLPRYPAEDTKLRALSSKQAGGGPVATGLTAAAKLGCRAGYIGVLADDAGGSFLKADFQKYGVDCSETVSVGGCRSFTSQIWLSESEKTRTCVFDKGDLPPLSLSDSQKRAVKEARLLMLDGNELSAAIDAAHIAKENGADVLYDAGGLYEGVERLLPLASILIPSEEFALGITGLTTAEQAAEKLYGDFGPKVVVITQGKRGGIMFDGSSVRGYPALPAEVVDSNGAGDVFHGAFAAGLMHGYSYYDCCIFASAVSAIKCTGFGARESVPNFDTVIKYLKENGYEF